MKYRLRVALSVLLLLGLFFYSGELSGYLQVLDKLSVLGILTVLLLVMLDRLLMTYKWLRLLAMRDVNAPLLPSMKIYCYSLICGLFLPATIGADSARIYCMRNMGFRLSELVASVLVERILGFIAVASVALVGTLYLASGHPDSPLFSETLIIVAFTLSLSIVMFLISLNDRVFRWALSLLPDFVRKNIYFGKVIDFHGLYVGYKSQNAELMLFYVLSFLEQLLVVTIFWVICLDLGVGIEYLQLLGAVMITLIVARIPISPGGLGVFEGTFVMMLALYGIEPTVSLSMAIIYRVLQILASLPWFIVHSFERKSIDTKGPLESGLVSESTSFVKVKGR